MDSIYDELKKVFQNFRWIDDIPKIKFDGIRYVWKQKPLC